ncbi:hypothetical protein D9611_005435 [Ephemerocybe angulata]|uniref:Uncharacterized protein n=2 Tax=Ephemerocybe angulata TaxID=980116 RepID=A0A8H6M5R0_9AGAR|nr:hypothetical protein D9611_005435 [Tulosesus angulatus]KAF6753171.1 hypothetical protein DFP72DRAFT_1170984 [Tulosesus angulatus]
MFFSRLKDSLSPRSSSDSLSRSYSITSTRSGTHGIAAGVVPVTTLAGIVMRDATIKVPKTVLNGEDPAEGINSGLALVGAVIATAFATTGMAHSVQEAIKEAKRKEMEADNRP